jgi:hypothetical protein
MKSRHQNQNQNAKNACVPNANATWTVPAHVQNVNANIKKNIPVPTMPMMTAETIVAVHVEADHVEIFFHRLLFANQ